jgi:tetratricopeptide (TPR) repeat protein
LINAATGRYLWSEIYDRQIEDLFAIQEELARAIVGTLQVQLRVEEQGALARPRRQNVEAYNLYLKGRYHFNRRTEEGLYRSIEFYEQAIALEPDSALAYAGLADSYALFSHYGMCRPHTVMAKATAAALKALELDPALAEAHTSLGLVMAIYYWDWTKSQHHFQTALRLNPGYVVAHHWYGYDCLAALGHLDEALVHAKRALELDPLSLISISSLAGIHIMRREYDLAMQCCEALLELDSNYYKAYTSLGRIYSLKGMHDVAIEQFQRARALSGGLPYVTASLAHAYAMAGFRPKAEELRRELLKEAHRRHVPTTSLALIAAGLGEMDEAFRWLEKASEEREGPLVFIKVYPTYECLASDPRFSALLRRMGLTEAV